MGQLELQDELDAAEGYDGWDVFAPDHVEFHGAVKLSAGRLDDEGDEAA